MATVNTIVNAAPLVIDRGTEDNSQVPLPLEAVPVPQHLPVFYIQTQKGPKGPKLVTASEREELYGSESFNPVGPYTNHATIGSNIVAAAGNTAIISRITNGDSANMALYLDVILEDIPVYERDTAGQFALDGTGQLIDTGVTTPGARCRWVLQSTPSYDESTLGTLATQDGFLGTPGTPSTMYPILELGEQNPGGQGNNAGIRLWANTERDGNVDVEQMLENKVFPYKLAVIERPDQYTTPSVVESIFGERDVVVSFAEDAYDEVSATSYNIADVLTHNYNNTTDGRYPKVYGHYDDYIHLYQSNVNYLVETLMALELAYIAAEDPVTELPVDQAEQDGAHLFNLVSGEDHTGIPYYTFVIDEDAVVTNGIKPTKFTNIYGKNGLDNILSCPDYEAEVVAELNRYADADDSIMDMAVNPESILYDTGFSDETKLELAKFISVRKDTFVVLSTHSDTYHVKGYIPTDPPIVWTESDTQAEDEGVEVSKAIILLGRLRMLPESEYFGTEVMRGMIMGGSGKLRNSQWKRNVTLTMDLMRKAANYMGASNGSWDSNERFSRAPGNIITDIYDINIPWVPASRRIRNWDVGLNLPIHYDTRQMFQPALQTVYPDDTSVLNNFLTAMAICQLNKIAHASWREFSGVDDMTDGELIQEVNDFVSTAVEGAFDDRYVIVPEAFMTTNDEKRGYSWTLPIKIYAANMKTVLTTYVQAYRISDLDQ